MPASLSRIALVAATVLLNDWAAGGTPDQSRAAIVAAADHLLDEASVSYVYGGSRLGDPATCQACNSCLEEKHPAASQRLKACPTCRQCSLDCSHFTALVFADAGLPYPYLDTSLMLSLSGEALRRRYHLVDMGDDPARAAVGDLLVYDGHVVLLERLSPPRPGDHQIRGDVVHSTSGRAIRAPGEGIQRERFIDIATFRGPLRRILRHEGLLRVQAEDAARAAPSPSPLTPAPGRLRPVAKRAPGD